MSEWISAKDRLPTELGWYLVYRPPHQVVSLFEYKPPYWMCRWPKEVTHWQPLPEPPKMGGK